MTSLFFLSPIYLRDAFARLVLLRVHELSIQTILKKFLRGSAENSFYEKLEICIQPLRFTWYDNSLSCFIVNLYIRIICCLLNVMLNKKSLDFTLGSLAYPFFVKKGIIPFLCIIFHSFIFVTY